MSWFDTILWPLKVAVAWIMVQFHSLFVALGVPSESGLAWAGSIVGLVVVIRILLIPLFVKQIKASRGMQLLAPDMQKIQKKYKGKSDPASREAMSRETMELYRKHGTNPFASCLPILAQSPIFFALFRVLYSLGDVARGEYQGGDRLQIGPLTQDLAAEANAATIFGAPISSFFLETGATGATRVVTVLLIIAMSATTFLTQRQLTQKNMPASALQGPMAQQQKMLLYLLPVIFAVTGVNFPIGVLIYWTTTNLWSMGQQFYVIRRNPTPGSEAERQLKERRARKAAAKGIVLEEEKPAVEEKPRGQRQQPKRKHRTKPVTGGAAAGAAASGDGPDASSSSEDGESVSGDTAAPGKTKAGGGAPGSRTTGAKSPGSKSAGAKTPGSKTSGTRAGGTKSSGATTGGARPSGAKPGRTKPSGTKPDGATGKPGTSSPSGRAKGKGTPDKGTPENPTT
ncbi:membrane protein insertase YidC [Actinotalea sp. BY-33]|uniref:Membrane protein insertase YidC n=1 Tax=Actinotalea soli TaxID=2819234 RepID=A0A939LNM8_9CELL|nr:membrane protein insertase YidC [Actinotalea soli]MBO1751171.1 membrane protein insertase YidC [Actinotalea soli]